MVPHPVRTAAADVKLQDCSDDALTVIAVVNSEECLTAAVGNVVANDDSRGRQLQDVV